MRKHFPTTWYCETLSPRFVENLRREALGKDPANGQRGFCFLFTYKIHVDFTTSREKTLEKCLVML